MNQGVDFNQKSMSTQVYRVVWLLIGYAHVPCTVPWRQTTRLFLALAGDAIGQIHEF